MSGASSERSVEHWLVLAGCLLLPLGLIALGLFLEPDPRGFGTHEQLGFRPCFPMRHWNVPCPGCGVTTSLVLALHGAPAAALRTQPFGLVVLACGVIAPLWAVAGHVRGRDLYARLPLVPWRRVGLLLVSLGALAWIYKLALVRGWLG